MHNTTYIAKKLPTLPDDLDIFIIRSKNEDTAGRIRNQFRADFKFSRSKITTWLNHLRRDHPEYQDIVIDKEILSQLLEDGYVDDQVPIHEVDEVATDEMNDDDIKEPDGAAAPDNAVKAAEMGRLRQAVGRQTEELKVLTEPSISSQPLNDFDESLPIMSMTFQMLFPTGAGDYSISRLRPIRFSMYMEHLYEHKN